jgi:hypothetical protein
MHHAHRPIAIARREIVVSIFIWQQLLASLKAMELK